MKENNELKCPFCGAILEKGYVHNKVEQGVTSLLNLTSSGINATLYWSKGNKKLFSSKEEVLLNKSNLAYRCSSCKSVAIKNGTA